ncbi:MAG: 2-amino-3,7-dideoxy-D-threo-hept-6-ulosonate synthase [Thaumarchaeota archaeon]|nr:2-amino-3,7-dideoxy-D-threo-hept-6-ulosonate synthase [Nitrososphaerota archaeon]
MVTGKDVRLSRIMKNGRMLCIPMDHSLTVGPIEGLEDPERTIIQVAKGGATSFLVQKGIIKSLRKPVPIGMIIQLSASTTLGMAPNRKILISSVEESIRLGVDAISLHVNIGGKEEPEMLQQLGMVADACDEYQIPFIAMMYPRGENIKDPSDPVVVAHVARIGAEAGADIVKTVYTGTPESFHEVVRKCPVPVVLAGGAKVESDLELLKMTSDVMKAGAIGVTYGRNVFQHKNPGLIVRALKRVVIDKATPEEAMEVFKSDVPS